MEKENSNTETPLAIQAIATPVISETLGRLIEDCSVQGLNGAIIVFLRKRGLADNEEVAVKFAQLITAEFGTEEEAKSYPLSASIAQRIREALNQSVEVFIKLDSAGEEENLRKLVRVIVSGEMLIVMQDKLEEVMKVYNDLK